VELLGQAVAFIKEVRVSLHRASADRIDPLGAQVRTFGYEHQRPAMAECIVDEWLAGDTFKLVPAETRRRPSRRFLKNALMLRWSGESP
jgi:hypothetical protein